MVTKTHYSGQAPPLHTILACGSARMPPLSQLHMRMPRASLSACTPAGPSFGIMLATPRPVGDPRLLAMDVRTSAALTPAPVFEPV